MICWANRNGFYYVLDRATGQFLTGTAFVKINWVQGLTPEGKPIGETANPLSIGGRVTNPGVAGGTNWQPAAFDPMQELIFVPSVESQSVFTRTSSDKPTIGREGRFTGSGGSIVGSFTTVVRALDAVTGAKDGNIHLQKVPGLAACSLRRAASCFGASGGWMFALIR